MVSTGGATWLISGENLARISALAGRTTAKLAVRIAGWDGDKLSVLLMDDAGIPQAIAKVGKSDSCQKLLKNELAWLKYCDNIHVLNGNRPSIINSGQIGDFFVVVETVGSAPVLRRNAPFTRAHNDFLSALQSIGPADDRFLHGEMYNSIRRCIATHGHRMSRKWLDRIEHALPIIENGLGDGDAPPVGVAHRDFTPWNMRQSERALFVFDWEQACRGCPPLYDILHYHLAPQATRRSLTLSTLQRMALGDIFHYRISPHMASRFLSVEWVKETIGKARQIGAGLKDGEAKTRRIDVQMLGYLLDKSLMHLNAHEGRDVGWVESKYGALIDQYEEWMTA
jgi:Phosphotransferase enzyme family